MIADRARRRRCEASPRTPAWRPLSLPTRIATLGPPPVRARKSACLRSATRSARNGARRSLTRSDDKPWSARVRDALRRRADAVPEPSGPAATDDDARLFRESIGDVRRLQEPGVAEPTRSRPAPEPLQSERDEASVRDELL